MTHADAQLAILYVVNLKKKPLAEKNEMLEKGVAILAAKCTRSLHSFCTS